VQVAVGVPRVPRTVRPLQGHLMSAPAATRVHRRLEFHPLRVASVERLTEDSVAVTFEVPPPLAEEYAFAAGQHLTLRRTVDGQDVRRSYSICAPVGGPLRVAIKGIPGGLFSTHALTALAAGDELDVLTPTGTFTTAFDPARARHYAAIAAGSGITPVLSLIETALAVEPESRCTLLYGNRTIGSVMFLEELADLKDRYPSRFHLVHVLSREAGEVELFHGRLDPQRLNRLFDVLIDPSEVDEWFVCGPYGMVSGAERVLAEHRVPASAVRVELFFVEDAPVERAIADAAVVADAAEVSDVTIVLDGRSSTVSMRRDERVLDAALRVRGELPFACKGGVCSTCRAKLLDGEVQMVRNYALEPDEVAAGYVLTCQSHPRTDTVTLDYDA
jgi:ring-1,2-phenylacetyl-CoA epoxidase subunit PaaE